MDQCCTSVVEAGPLLSLAQRYTNAAQRLVFFIKGFDVGLM